eukprot:368199_1
MAYPIFLRQFNGNLQIVIDTKSRKNKVIRTQYLRCLNHKCNALRDAFYEEMNRPMTTNRSQISVVSNSNSNRNNGNAFVSDYVQDIRERVCGYVCDTWTYNTRISQTKQQQLYHSFLFGLMYHPIGCLIT